MLKKIREARVVSEFCTRSEFGTESQEAKALEPSFRSVNLEERKDRLTAYILLQLELRRRASNTRKRSRRSDYILGESHQVLASFFPLPNRKCTTDLLAKPCIHKCTTLFLAKPRFRKAVSSSRSPAARLAKGKPGEFIKRLASCSTIRTDTGSSAQSDDVEPEQRKSRTKVSFLSKLQNFQFWHDDEDNIVQRSFAWSGWAIEPSKRRSRGRSWSQYFKRWG